MAVMAEGGRMKKTLIMLAAIICLASLCAYAESPGTAPSKDAAAAAAPKPSAESAAQKPTSTATVAPSTDVKTQGQAAKGADSKCCGWLWLIAFIPSGMFVLFMLITKSSLKNSTWNLGDALSESEPVKNKDGDILKDAAGNPVFAKSASRLIAFVGFFVIIFWLMGLSIPTLYHFACTGEVPKLNDVSTFLLAQAGTFAPYIANKLVSAIKS